MDKTWLMKERAYSKTAVLPLITKNQDGQARTHSAPMVRLPSVAISTMTAG
jgi:hypothetical protein